MKSGSLRLARKVSFSLVAGSAILATALGGASTASAAALSQPRVKMTLPRSIAPSPRFMVPGVCGTSGPNNSQTCSATVIKAIDDARKSEPLDRITPRFNLAAFDRLSLPEQIFAIVNIERTARRLAPIAGLTSQLNAIAAAGARSQTDPTVSLPLQLAGGGESTTFASNMAEGTANALGADYFWMYDDGPNSPNADCQRAGDAGCWGHRKNILNNYASPSLCPAGWHTTAVMGASEIKTGVGFSPSITEIFVNACGGTPKLSFTWADVQKLVFGN
jgi:hypothetical protein